MLIGETTVSKGTVNASIITPRELFIEALQNIETAGYMLGLAEEEVYLNEQRNANRDTAVHCEGI
jgi:hypothetical protein